MDKYGERLKAARKRKGLTQTQLAEQLGITQKSYQRMESGSHDLKMSTICSLCRALDISADWLLGLNVNIQGRVITFPGSDFGCDLAAEPVILEQGK